ncbi:MAG: flavin-containing monooxygenase [Pirellulaceae bacterium]|jgi:monooxygenase
MEYVDVVVVGAGISGIGAAYHLQKLSPGRSFVLLEARQDIGGTWDLFRYPGVRSDSDMYTLGYHFKPWTNPKTIADGASIKDYLRDTVREYRIDRHIRFGQRVIAASWSSHRGRWTVSMADQQGGTSQISCNFLFMCAGYYSYRSGYRAEIPGIGSFRGQVVHPQFWPEQLDYAGKKVVVIGSGATAMTIVPAMARDAAHVTMIQRSPTYVVSRPDVDKIALLVRTLLPKKLAYRAIRWKNTTIQQFFFGQIRKHPNQAKHRLIEMVRARLGRTVDVDRHFTPSYSPWDQRLCLLPNGDLLDALRDGDASIVTDTIAGFDAHAVRLHSGGVIEADIVVTATGLQLVVLGEAHFDVDGKPIDFANTFTYKGLGFSGVPNLVSSFGYINASWTLKSDLTCEYVCRLLNHMTQTGTQVCTPKLRAGEESMLRRPWIDGFTPGYMLRDMHRFPSQGDREPWLNPQNFKKDVKLYRHATVDDGVMLFTKANVATQ